MKESMREERVLSLGELAREVGIEYRTAKNWHDRGIIQAHVREANGSGHPALFDDFDVQVAWTARELRDAGFEVAALERLAPSLHETEHWQRVCDAINGKVPGIENPYDR